MDTRSWITHLIAATLLIALCGSPAQRQTGEAAPLAGSTAPSLWVTPLRLDFGPVGVGETSNQQVVTITNNGNATLAGFAGGAVHSPFNASQNCAAGVPPGESCQYFFQFSPTETGVFTATSSSSTNAGPFSIELLGEGVGPGLHVNPLALDFGLVLVGNTDTQAVTIHNTGLSKLNWFMGYYEPPFHSGAFCTQGILPGESCDFYISFSPTEAGTFTATVDFDSDAGPFSIDLMGQGRTDAFESGQRVTPRTLDFGPVGVGLSAPTLAVTITNQSLFQTITNWAGGGVFPPFTASQNCAGGVPPNGSCQLYYTFQPTETGVFTATSDLTNSYGSFTIQLRGEGAGAGISASPLRLDFGAVAPGDTSAMQTVTVRNTGLATLTDFSGGGMYPPFNAFTSCAVGVPPGGECQLSYVFEPTERGRFSASSNVWTNAGGITIEMSGGLEVPALALAFYPNQISPGGTATLYYTIHNPNPNTTLFDLAFGSGNTFPSGMSVASPLNYSASPECGAPAFTPASGATTILFSEGTLLGGNDCVVSVDVSAGDIGVYTYTAGPVDSAAGSGNSASASLRVGAIVYMPLIKR
jgi:hypothetical protein